MIEFIIFVILGALLNLTWTLIVRLTSKGN
ncbi:hypothetical protein SEA_BOGOTA_70 [Streptomyces phage Bogota]|jgi:hypothetical protein|nr:hypothetical protein SEA_BOGOTA_70 [Streptomyces phage Bogota]